MKMPNIDIDNSTVAIVAGVAVLAYLMLRAGSAIAEAVPNVVAGSADMASGLLTGNNAITEGARTDAYQDAGVLGTLGAATDRALGGVPSKIGESLGS